MSRFCFFLHDFHPLISNDLDPLQSGFLQSLMEAGEEGREDAVLKYPQGRLDKLTPSSFSMPQQPRETIISNYLQTSLGTRESQEVRLLERLLNDALLMMDQQLQKAPCCETCKPARSPARPSLSESQSSGFASPSGTEPRFHGSTCLKVVTCSHLFNLHHSGCGGTRFTRGVCPSGI